MRFYTWNNKYKTGGILPASQTLENRFFLFLVPFSSPISHFGSPHSISVLAEQLCPQLQWVSHPWTGLISQIVSQIKS